MSRWMSLSRTVRNTNNVYRFFNQPNTIRQQQGSLFCFRRTFATTNNKEGESNKNNNENLRETLNRIRGNSGSQENDDQAGGSQNEFFQRAAKGWSYFSEELSNTWQELLQSNQRKNINKKIHHMPTKEGDSTSAASYDGPLEIMVIDESENLTAWERMQKRLTEAPIIQGMMSANVSKNEK